MKHLRYFLLAALVAMPLTACDEDSDPVKEIIVGTVTGTVSAGSDGLSGVAVNLVGGVSQSAATGAGGTYTFTNVPAGSYGVSIDASSHPDVSFSQTSRTTTISINGETQTVDFSGSYIKTSAITGLVSAGGAPVDATVTLTGGPENVSESTGTAGGTYSFTGLRAGSYTVAISGYAGVTFATLSHDVSVNTGETKTVHFTGEAVQMAMISGAVTVDNVGTAGIKVALSGGATAETETGPGGAFSFTNLTPGDYTVTITAPDEVAFETLTKDVTVNAGETGVVNFAGTGPMEPATISIKSITQENQPVTLSNVSGQIEVTLNITRNDQTLYYVDVLIDEVVVATQEFQLGEPPADMASSDIEEVTLNVPTTQLQMLVVDGDTTWVPAVYNGGRELSANLVVTELDKPIPTNKVPIVLQNRDVFLPGFSYRGDLSFTPDEPDRMAYDTQKTPEAWYAGSATFRGIQWIAYSTVTPEDVEFDSECGYPDTKNFETVFGDAFTGITVVNTYTCAKMEESDVLPSWDELDSGDVTYDDDELPGPDGTAVRYDDDIASIGAEFMLSDPMDRVGPRRYVIDPDDVESEQISEPDELNMDNLGPVVDYEIVAFNELWDEHWINEDFDLVEGVILEGKNHEDDDVITLEDWGVGPDHASRKALEVADSLLVEDDDGDYYVYNCGDEITNADLLPTIISGAPDGHRICGTGTDLLGNAPRHAMYFSEWFGKDILDPVVAVAHTDRGGFGGWTLPPITFYADSVELNAEENLFNVADKYDDGTGDPRGWGIDASDDAAGFHQNYSGTGVGPAVQTFYRFYPDPAKTTTLVDTMDLTTWIGDQLAVPGETWVRSSDVGFGVGGAVEELYDPTDAGADPGLYLFEAMVYDMAGNTSTLKRNFAVDQENGPSLSTITLGSLAYTPGVAGPFNMWGMDDFEVDLAQVGMTYMTTVGAINLWYPPSKVDPAISPWDMDYPFDVLAPYAYNASYGGAGILGRVDFTDATGDITGIVNVDSPHDADAVAEKEDMLPYELYGLITADILGNPTTQMAVGPVPFVSYDFGGFSATVAEPWTALGADFVKFSLIDKSLTPPDIAFGGDFKELVAEHVTTKSVVAPFFTKVFLIHNDGVNLNSCGELSVLARTDEGVNRYYRYGLSATDAAKVPDVCTTAGSLHAIGLKGAAGLITAPAVSLTWTPPAP